MYASLAITALGIVALPPALDCHQVDDRSRLSQKCRQCIRSDASPCHVTRRSKF